MDDQTYEVNLKRFIQSAEFQLKKLGDCIYRLNEFQGYEDWTNVKQAHLNASQIIKRIKADIKEIERIRSDIVLHLEDKSSNQVVNRGDEQLKDVIKRLEKQIDDIECICAPYHRFELKNSSYILEASIGGPELYSYELQTNEYIAQDKDLCKAYDQFQRDADDLKRAVSKLSNEIYRPKDTIDSIERNDDGIDGSGSNANGSYRYKTALGTAASGALIGTIIGGPVGFFAGAKLGTIVGLGSGAVGYIATRYFKK